MRALEKCTKCTTFDLSSKAKLKPVLSKHDLETRLDCNALYVGVSRGFRARLQPVAAAHLLIGTHSHEHVTRVLSSLHRLPVHDRIHFKVLTLVY